LFVLPSDKKADVLGKKALSRNSENTRQNHQGFAQAIFLFKDRISEVSVFPRGKTLINSAKKLVNTFFFFGNLKKGFDKKFDTIQSKNMKIIRK